MKEHNRIIPHIAKHTKGSWELCLQCKADDAPQTEGGIYTNQKQNSANLINNYYIIQQVWYIWQSYYACLNKHPSLTSAYQTDICY
jgi:hypothetical protein